MLVKHLSLVKREIVRERQLIEASFGRNEEDGSMYDNDSSSRIMRRLTTLFPSEELGVVERDRKFQIPAFVWAFVFGFAAGESRIPAGFRRCYNSTADETISPGGFYQRLTPTLAEYLCDLVEAALDEIAVPNSVEADLDQFRDVMIADGTVLRLHEFLSDQLEARHEE